MRTKSRCTNRRHGLSKPPPVRKDRPLPRHGCRTCEVMPNGSDACPYRAAYQCDDRVRTDGLLMGLCAVEHAHRHEVVDPLEALFEQNLEDPERADALRALALFADAEVHTFRSRAWAGIVSSTKTPLFGVDGEVDRALDRYRADAANRLVLRYSRLRPFIDKAKAKWERVAVQR